MFKFALKGGALFILTLLMILFCEFIVAEPGRDF